MSALDRRRDVIRALSASGHWQGSNLPLGSFLHRHKSVPLAARFSAGGGVELTYYATYPFSGGGSNWATSFASSVPDRIVLAVCQVAVAEFDK